MDRVLVGVQHHEHDRLLDLVSEGARGHRAQGEVHPGLLDHQLLYYTR